MELDKKGIAYDHHMEVGIMVETPAAALISDKLAKEVDFFSIGTNDLSQYTLVVDRTSRVLSDFFNPHHPAVLKLIQMTVENAHKAGIWVACAVNWVPTFPSPKPSSAWEWTNSP
mgnify:CR=1 FL=1